MKVRAQIMLDHEDVATIRQLCDEHGDTLSSWCRRAIKQKIRDESIGRRPLTDAERAALGRGLDGR